MRNKTFELIPNRSYFSVQPEFLSQSARNRLLRTIVKDISVVTWPESNREIKISKRQQKVKITIAEGFPVLDMSFPTLLLVVIGIFTRRHNFDLVIIFFQFNRFDWWCQQFQYLIRKKNSERKQTNSLGLASIVLSFSQRTQYTHSI